MTGDSPAYIGSGPTRSLTEQLIRAALTARGLADTAADILTATGGVPMLVDSVIDELAHVEHTGGATLERPDLDAIVDRTVLAELLHGSSVIAAEIVRALAVAPLNDLRELARMTGHEGDPDGALVLADALLPLPTALTATGYELEPHVEASVRRLMLRHEPERFALLCGVLAVIRAEDGSAREAAGLAVRSNDPVVARAAIRLDWRVLVHEHNARLSQLALTGLSAEDATPGVLLGLAKGARYGQHPDAESVLAVLDRGMRALQLESTPDPVVAIAFESMMQLALCGVDDIGAAYARISDVDAMVGLLAPQNELANLVLVGKWKVRSGHTLLLRGELARARTRTSEGVEALRNQPGTTTALVEGLGQLALLAALDNRFDDAATLIGAADGLAEPWHLGTVVEARIIAARSMLELERVDLAALELSLAHFAVAARSSEFELPAGTMLGQFDLLSDRPLRGIERFRPLALDQMPESGRGLFWRRAVFVQARLLIANGELLAAESLLAAAVIEGDATFVARIALARGNPAAALAVLDAEPRQRASRNLEQLLLSSACLYGLDRRSEALAALFSALALATFTGSRHAFHLLMHPFLEPLIDAIDETESPAELAPLIRELKAVTNWPQGVRTVAALSGRESIVLGNLDSTLTIDAIARALFVSPDTLKSQLRSLYRKLGASNRFEAVQIAKQLGLLQSTAA